VQGLATIATAVGVMPVTGPGASGGGEAGGRARGRRSSKASGDKETPLSAPAHLLLETQNLDAIVAAVQRLASAGAVRGGQGGGEGGDGSQGIDGSPGGGGGGAGLKDDVPSAGKLAAAASAGDAQERGERSLEHQLAKTSAELDKTKTLFSRAMLNAAALEMDIKKLQEAARGDKVRSCVQSCVRAILRALLPPCRVLSCRLCLHAPSMRLPACAVDAFPPCGCLAAASSGTRG
jgi:hypothetical protein